MQDLFSTAAGHERITAQTTAGQCSAQHNAGACYLLMARRFNTFNHKGVISNLGMLGDRHKVVLHHLVATRLGVGCNFGFDYLLAV
jgi:hypothetical protein